MIVLGIEKEIVLRKLRTLGGKAGRRIIRKATKSSGVPVRKKLKQLIPRRGEYGLGTLKRNIVTKLSSNARAGKFAAVVGAKRRATGRPSRYFHLVDKGQKAHAIRPREKLSKTESKRGDRLRANISFFVRGVGLVARPSAWHPGYAGQDYIRRATEQSKADAIRAFIKKAEEELRKEAATA